MVSDSVFPSCVHVSGRVLVNKRSWYVGLFTNTFRVLFLPKPHIFLDVFLTPEVAPLIIRLLWETLGQGAQWCVDEGGYVLVWSRFPGGRNET